MLSIKRKIYFRTTAALLLLAGLTLIINSCKKNFKDAADTGMDPDVAMAKAWYETAYPQNAGGALAAQATRSGRKRTDFSQLIKPNWQHSAKYKRFNKDVIEMPVDSSAMVKFKLKNDLKSYNRDYTRGYYLFLKTDTG